MHSKSPIIAVSIFSPVRIDSPNDEVNILLLQKMCIGKHLISLFMPDWSPDGARIAFVSTRTGGNNQEIFTMDADGANPLRQTDFAAIDSLPAWSPNGKIIGFNRDLGGSNFEIVQLTPRVLDTDPVPPPTNLTNDPANDNQPNWQPK